MQRHLLACAALAALSLPLSAQIQVKVAEATGSSNGVVLVKSDNTQVIKNLPAPTNTYYQYVTYYLQNPYTYMSTYLSGPYSSSMYTLNRFGVSTRLFARKGSGHKSMYLTGDAKGTTKIQKYTVTISSPKATQIQMDLSAYGYVYDNSNAGFKVTDGNQINETYSYTKVGYNRTTKSIKLNLAANTPVTLSVEATGSCTPGAGSNQYYDGYYASLYCNILEVGNGSATLKGTGCGTPTMVSGGTPTKGASYTFGLTGGPAKGAAAFLFGYSDKLLGNFIQLPLPLDYMGAKGCSLYVGYTYPWARTIDANGKADVKLYLSPYYNGTVFGQWVVFDPKANSAGLTLTQYIELKY